MLTYSSAWQGLLLWCAGRPMKRDPNSSELASETNRPAQPRSSIQSSPVHETRDGVKNYRWRGASLTEEAHGVGDYSQKLHEYLKRRNQPAR